MNRISTGFSIAAIGAVLSCFALASPSTHDTGSILVARKPDFSGYGVDPTPVGTAKQMDRLRRGKAAPKV